VQTVSPIVATTPRTNRHHHHRRGEKASHKIDISGGETTPPNGGHDQAFKVSTAITTGSVPKSPGAL